MFIVHYGEIGIKGKNRDVFEKRLVSNIRQHLKPIEPGIKVSRRQGYVAVESSNAEVGAVLGRVSGVEYFLEAAETAPTLEAMSESAVTQMKGAVGTFRVTAKRIDKSFPMTSQETAAKIGEAVLRAHPGLRVDLHHPDNTIHVEIGRGGSFVAGDKRRGIGGLPVGTSGKLVSLISGGIDSPVASWMMLKRGAPLHFVSFHNFPYTDRGSIDIVKDLIGVLNKNAYKSSLSLFNLTPVQEEIVAKCDPRHRVLLYRRMMFRLAERVAAREKAKGFVTGESLGQVASQTIENLSVVEDVTVLPILRPLIGMDKEEIIAIAKRIGTYDLSIRPHSDCCSLFVPANPATKAKLEDILEDERHLDIPKILEYTLAQEERNVI
jgi:thiamine biosynthesis protein ThiI